MRVTFCDLNAAVVDALSEPFADVKTASFVVGDIMHSIGGALVSPANSYGAMDGGIDLAYSLALGWHVQARVQEAIGALFDGELPVGCAVSVQTDSARFPLLIAAPTMRWPGPIANPIDVCRAAFAAFAVARINCVEHLLCPGMGTLTGRVPPEVAAVQMRRAWAGVFGG